MSGLPMATPNNAPNASRGAGMRDCVRITLQQHLDHLKSLLEPPDSEEGAVTYLPNTPNNLNRILIAILERQIADLDAKSTTSL